MSLRDDILAAYRGEKPAKIPFMLDLSHWFYHRLRKPWDLSAGYEHPEYELIDYHRRRDIGFYMPNLAAFFQTRHAAGVTAEVRKSSDGRTIAWSYRTPKGVVERTRVWEERTYAWGIPSWSLKTPEHLEIFAGAMEGRAFSSDWKQYRMWREAVGDAGVVYLPVGYSAVGQLLNYWMGVEETIFAAEDDPALFGQVVDAVNASNLRLIDLACESPAEVVIMGDNFSGDIQPPAFFARWSRAYYAEAIRRLHAAGKFAAIHIDGLLRGCLGMFAEIDADAADAVTPAPGGDLTPGACRAEAGPRMLLSGGPAAPLWLESCPRERFEAAMRSWLGLAASSSRFIANAGDQVPPYAPEERIFAARDMARSAEKAA